MCGAFRRRADRAWAWPPGWRGSSWGAHAIAKPPVTCVCAWHTAWGHDANGHIMSPPRLAMLDVPATSGRAMDIKDI